MKQTPNRLSVAEFASLAAMLFSLVALSIDAMLPAITQIATDLGVANRNDAQLVIGVFFLGNAFGQLLFGPLSDSFGRKRVIVAGLILFLFGCLVAVVSQSFSWLLIGRLLQGLGAAGPRTVMVSMVRDLYVGTAMARIMSISMSIFILVPIIAPAVGQAILWVASWRYIFGTFFLTGFVALFWLLIRQPETLSVSSRRPLKIETLASGFMVVCRSRVAVGYTLAMGAMFGAFVGFLSSVQQIFQDTFQVGDQFPFLFAILAVSFGVASLVNSRIVVRFGMKIIISSAMTFATLVSAAYFMYCLSVDTPSLMSFMLWGVLCFLGIGLVIGNINALAMEPLGQVAGLGAALVGFLSSFTSFLIGVPIGRAYDGTVVPVITGFMVFGVVSLGLILWTGRNTAVSGAGTG
ncbi:uncharacterized protein METZ01_LOCUS145342 [marine metagenome]|uniref:Major facilitator superfamily (MFS) profile domain-containing protein n=1 Tax=marine metagenome TaxID=408172 RepID=A0A381ZT76_9ZZZZ